MRLSDGARKLASRCLMPLAQRAARAYVAGENLDDALRVADHWQTRGLGTTLGYWDAPGDSAESIAEAYRLAIRSLACRQHSYVSIKVPSLNYSTELMHAITTEARESRVRLHFDALGPETADASRALFDRYLEAGTELSYTLPGRWLRSKSDAAWAAERGIVVRVVKGQWPDPADRARDLRQGYLEVIDALAGKAHHVAVATHDVPLAAAAIERLRQSGTSCELELLHGLPMKASLAQADRLSVGVRVYVGYGKAYLPYALGKLRQNPRMAWWLLRDALGGRGE